MSKKVIITVLSFVSLFDVFVCVYADEFVTQYVAKTFDAEKLIIPIVLKILFYVFLWLDGTLAIRWVIKASDRADFTQYLLITKIVILLCAVFSTIIMVLVDFHLRIKLLRIMASFLTVNLLTISWLCTLKNHS